MNTVISKIPYGNPPTIIGKIPLEPSEHMIFLYLPIKMAGNTLFRYPERLRYLNDLLGKVHINAGYLLGTEYADHYVYLTAKTMWVEPGAAGNRPGWHADGYGSNGDLNYIWHDMNPTQFAVQQFTDIPDDDVQSMVEMERQVDLERLTEYPDRTLLRLDETVVHRVNPTVTPGLRTFIKLSVSKHQYNLKGNSHNHLFDYDWDLVDRAAVRNVDNKDFVK